jgi:hypothetical protein
MLKKKEYIFNGLQIQNNLLMLAYNNSNNTTQGSGANAGQNSASYLQEIKGIIKTWRTRLPLINDDLSYWNDIFTWRQFHYESFTSFYEKQQQAGHSRPDPSFRITSCLICGEHSPVFCLNNSAFTQTSISSFPI